MRLIDLWQNRSFGRQAAGWRPCTPVLALAGAGPAAGLPYRLPRSRVPVPAYIVDQLMAPVAPKLPDIQSAAEARGDANMLALVDRVDATMRQVVSAAVQALPLLRGPFCGSLPVCQVPVFATP
jgi:hypothetical protein